MGRKTHGFDERHPAAPMGTPSVSPPHIRCFVSYKEFEAEGPNIMPKVTFSGPKPPIGAIPPITGDKPPKSRYDARRG